MVSPLGQHVDPQSGHFFYPRPYGEDPRSNILECNKDGLLVHDACLEIFKLLSRDTTSAIPPINLRDSLSVMDLGLADRNRDSFDCGYGDTFSEGPRFEFEGWVPWEDSEWTVIDPRGPFDLRPLIAEASTESESSFTFAFNQGRETQHHSDSRKSDYLSLIPYELRFRILKLLPTRFWESRLFFDVPWCADIVLSQMQQRSKVQWDELLRLLKEAYAVAGYDSDSLDYLTLKKRRRIWLQCERILRGIESQHSLKR
ncbi:hypothetical protein CNMCM8980_000386 [Aspergillus fumigatiaffinis]|uniref:Uncharacterized protein n=1 Tax=Aspergillus fumigatiaffinis TaxID=340414 RepID=A0A8H4H281_9EURO|nr:hypothetical protein CNMCM5878_000459 [Aspergillus fumigatiaffinis]KAF4233372.1 hypothetical protein CNMCM6457_004530 [Aspergillus fumigatiaffinis]KAF4242058.1 hypothetical protein CNMCM6805_003173 [Aspergillus fumigatiaffinis]KAF4250556.1 hypothetical protein CNMCM8980_000386 [Aspergillus fumigatiaffinis]